jgi:hypothetical protein
MTVLTLGDVALLALAGAAAIWPILLTWVLSERVDRDRQANLHDFVSAFTDIVEAVRSERGRPDGRD